MGRGVRWGLVNGVVLAAAAVGLSAPYARAADRAYWSIGFTNGPIRVGSLAGGGAMTLFGSESYPRGVAIDAAAGKIYWASQNGDAIRVANLDGTGTVSNLFTEPGGSEPEGLAINPATGKLYWADLGSGLIRTGSTAGGTASTLYSAEAGPWGVAIDPASSKIFWANSAGGLIGNAIRVGNLNGTGTATTLFGSEPNANGVAVDPVGGRLYWSDLSAGGLIRTGFLGGGVATTLFSSEGAPMGIAVDSTAGKLYWANYSGVSGGIRIGSTSGGTATDLFTLEPNSSFVALVRAPLANGAPAVSGGRLAGQPLACSRGGWAGDPVGSFLYRAPRTFAYQWLLNGVPLAGAVSSSYTPKAPGSYACRVTASNQAGSATQTSAAVTVKAGKPTSLGVFPSKFDLTGRRVNGKCLKPTSKNKHNKPCERVIALKVRYTLTGLATVAFTIKGQIPGRTVKGKCVKQTSKNAANKKCTEAANFPGSIVVGGKTGANAFMFAGKIGGKKLGPGKYMLTATTPSGSKSAKFTLTG